MIMSFNCAMNAALSAAFVVAALGAAIPPVPSCIVTACPMPNMPTVPAKTAAIPAYKNLFVIFLFLLLCFDDFYPCDGIYVPRVKILLSILPQDLRGCSAKKQPTPSGERVLL